MGHYDDCRPGYCGVCGAAPGNIVKGVCTICHPPRKAHVPPRPLPAPAPAIRAAKAPSVRLRPPEHDGSWSPGYQPADFPGGKRVSLTDQLGPARSNVMDGLRALRLWHWREFKKYRKLAVELAGDATEFNLVVDDTMCDTRANHHMRAVQLLNSFFEVDDYAERDDK